MFDDGTGVRRIAECQCTVVYDIRKHPEAAQYSERTKTPTGWRDPDIAVVFQIHFTVPCSEGVAGRTAGQIQVRGGVTS